MARLPDLVAFAQRHGLKIGTISDLIAYRRRHDNLIAERDLRPVSSAHGGEWMMRVFADEAQGAEHIVLSKGDLTTPEPVLVRMHALDPLQDLLGVGRTGDLPAAMRMIAHEGRGVVVLLRDLSPALPRMGDVNTSSLGIFGLYSIPSSVSSLPPRKLQPSISPTLKSVPFDDLYFSSLIFREFK